MVITEPLIQSLMFFLELKHMYFDVQICVKLKKRMMNVLAGCYFLWSLSFMLAEVTSAEINCLSSLIGWCCAPIAWERRRSNIYSCFLRQGHQALFVDIIYSLSTSSHHIELVWIQLLSSESYVSLFRPLVQNSFKFNYCQFNYN